MKKTVWALIFFNLMAGSFAQNVFTYGTKAVTKDEFVKAFDKNPNLSTDRKKALKEYLDLYINFKLKVQAAYDAGLDKDATQQYEVQNFRRQIADNIINDQANVKELVKQAFERSQKEIHLAQVFVEVPANADTADAGKTIQAAYKQLKEGKDFSTVAAEFSSDEATKQAKGDLGYVTAFTLPYNLENIVYELKPNTFSAPVKTKMGFHIFKNMAERKPAGTIKIEQILISYPPNGSSDDKNVASHKADSIYNLLMQGSNFETLAAAVSNDLSSSSNKGQLPEFTTGTYSADFEKVAFSLKNPGDISKPFETTYGFHILKLLEAKPIAINMDDPAVFASYQEKVTKDNRMELAKNDLIEKKLAIIKYKPSAITQKDLFAFTDSSLAKRSGFTYKTINDNSVIFSFARQNVKATDWLKYVRSIQNGMNQNGKNYSNLYKQYVRSMADEYYRNNMELYNADFARQVKEFKEANLLFGIMEQNVWGKANTDTAGLQQYYNQHKQKYLWPASADALIITCSNRNLAEEIQAKLKDSISSWRQITGNNGTDVVADSGRYELGQLPVVERTNFAAKLITTPVKNQNDGTYTFNYIFNLYRDPAQRNFNDARGLVISDYQQVLEDKWIAQLKKKYTVAVNEAVFKTIK